MKHASASHSELTGIQSSKMKWIVAYNVIITLHKFHTTVMHCGLQAAPKSAKRNTIQLNAH